jgi:hypothetical protein
LNLLDFKKVAALTPGECQNLRPVFREVARTGQGEGRRKRQKKAAAGFENGGETGMNRPSASGHFLGILAFNSNRLRDVTVVHVWFSQPFPRCIRTDRGPEQRRPTMNKFAKFALGALMVAGAATATTAVTTSPAEARGSFSFSFGYPGYYGGYYGPAYYGPAYYDPYYYRPYPYYYGRPYYGRPYWGGYRGYGYRGHYGYRGGYRGYRRW